MEGLITPCGGKLVDRLADPAEIAERARGAVARIRIPAGTRIHLVNIATGCYSPLTGFMTEADCRTVVESGRLTSGQDWKVPILLHIGPDEAAAVRIGMTVALCEDDGTVIAAMDVESVFPIDLPSHCRAVMGTDDAAHPGVANLSRQGTVCIGGPVALSRDAVGSQPWQNSPAQSRAALRETGLKSFTAFSTRNICHRGHEYQHRIALERTDLLGIHVITGAAVQGSFDSAVVLEVYETLIEKIYPPGRVLLNNLRLPAIYAGPKEAFLQATVLQNLGYTHFIVGRDHAGVGSYYERYASQEIFARPSSLEIEILPLAEPQYCPHCNRIVTEAFCDRPAGLEKLNGRDVRRILAEGNHHELDSMLRPDVRDLLIERNRTTALFVG